MRNLIVCKALSFGAALAAVGTLVAGPRVTVIGDSISAYSGTSIYAGYYPAHGVDSVDKMWWKIAIDAIGGELACDAAWSGSAVAGSGNDAMSSNHRLNKERLGTNPDLFLICAGTNDGRGNKPLGEFTYDFTSVDRTKFRPAFAYMLNWLQTNYPEAKILVIVNTDVDKLLGTTDEHWEQYATSMETIAAHYGIASMRIHDVEKGVESYAQSPSGKVQVHPTAAGMVTFGNQVAAACQLLLAPPVQPRAELSVSAGTPGTLNVACHLTDAGVDATRVNLFVGALPKGHEPSSIPVGTSVGELTAGGGWNGSISGLVPGYTYTVRLRLVNDLEAETNLFADCEVALAAPDVAFTYTGASTSTKLADGRTAITLTSSGTLTLPAAVTLNDLLVVGGGGGGGGNLGGGGGAGGVVMKSDMGALIPADSYDVVIGGGGAGGVSGAWKGGNGSETSVSLGTVVESAPGGGGGATYGSNAGSDGGSGGGGAGGGYGSGGGVAGSATFDDVTAGHYGNSGGSGVKANFCGGGGGATQAGDAATSSAAGAGGKGITCDFTGAPVVYAGGGGGGRGSRAIGGAGGDGGGGAGQKLNSNQDGEAGTDGLGGGGGGGSGSFANGKGGKGGSGCVVLRLTPRGSVRIDKFYYRERDRRLDVAFAELEDPTADIDLYWTDGDYTSDYSLWTKVSSVGTCAAARAVVTVDATARYIVFAVGSVYSRPLIVSELPNESEKLPEIEATMTLGRVSGGLRIRVNVEDIGFDAAALTASYGVRKRDDGDPATIPLDLIATDWQAGTAWTNDVTGLDLGETYAVRLRLENDQGDVKELISTYELSAFCAQDYVRHGLVAQWDGVDNAGPGAHAAGATAWVDLCGNSTPFAGENLTFGDKYARLGNRLTSECSAISPSYAPVTMEAYGYAETFVNPDGLASVYIFSSGFGMSFFWQRQATWLGISYVNNPTGKKGQSDGGGNGDLFSVPSHSALQANTWSLSQANSGRKVYVHGELGDFSGFKGYWFNDVAFNRNLVAGDANSPTRIYSYRVYGRQLMDGEIAYNAAIDRIRFEGADPALEFGKLEPFGFRWNAGQSRVEVRLRAQCNRGALSVAEAWYPMEETVSVDYTPDGNSCIAWRGLPQGAVVSDDKRRVTFALTAGTDLAVEAHLVPAKTAYVTRGLIAQWDGIDNVGTGEYDAGATAWVDLCGNSTPFEGDALTFGFGAATVTGARVTATCSKLGTSYGPVTMECCGFATRFAQDGSAQDFFALGAGCHLFFQGAANNFGVEYVKDGATGWHTLDGGNMSGNSFSVSSHAITDHNTWTLSQADNSRKIYLRGVNGDFSAGKGWYSSKATYSQVVSIGYANGGVDFRYQAVRVYDRQLSDAEIAYNAAIDRIRFEGASYSNEMAAVEAYGYRWNEERQRIEILITATGTRGEFKQDAIWCGIGEPVTFEFKTTQKGYRKVVWSGFDKKNLVARQRGTATFVFTEPHTVTATAEPGGDGLLLFVR